MATQKTLVHRLSIVVAITLLLACLSGCCRSSTGSVPVHGKVTLRGAPLEKATLTLFPIAGRPVPVSVVAGEYETELAPGEYVAVVDVAAELPPGFKEGDPLPPPKMVLPQHYTSRARSPLKATVVAGEANQVDFELK